MKMDGSNTIHLLIFIEKTLIIIMKTIKFTKKQIDLLKEGNAYVKPTRAAASSNSIANDINDTQKENPTDNSFVFDTSDYDGKSENNEPMFTIDAENAQDAQQKYNDMQKNPDFKRITDKGATCQVNMKNEGVIRYTKKELNRILFN